MLRPKTKWRLFRRKAVREGGNEMGAIRITVSIRNPADPERTWEGEFLVDTGATDTLVPRQHLESIGIVPEGQRSYRLAGGNEILMDIGIARIEFMGDFTAGVVAFGAENAEPLLGVTALESVGVEVDPHNQTISKLPATRMVGFRAMPSP